ncbi:hypothetical protein MKZ38_004181 [Zalerion maritima]|uniref:Uncharacterized protein n=1 Tax=Zalerion maritima TaxID=339359 RepID=A0AAD5RMN5_9PEZI|nr:hypothetical protein MKZ38_004181 [Zalerion maritima]
MIWMDAANSPHEKCREGSELCGANRSNLAQGAEIRPVGQLRYLRNSTGPVAGGIAFVTLVLGLVFFLRRRRRLRKGIESPEEEELKSESITRGLYSRAELRGNSMLSVVKEEQQQQQQILNELEGGLPFPPAELGVYEVAAQEMVVVDVKKDDKRDSNDKRSARQSRISYRSTHNRCVGVPDTG